MSYLEIWTETFQVIKKKNLPFERLWPESRHGGRQEERRWTRGWNTVVSLIWVRLAVEVSLSALFVIYPHLRRTSTHTSRRLDFILNMSEHGVTCQREAKCHQRWLISPCGVSQELVALFFFSLRRRSESIRDIKWSCASCSLHSSCIVNISAPKSGFIRLAERR